MGLLFFVGLAVLVIIVTSPSFKGAVGERAVRFYLSLLDSSQYKVYNDVLITRDNGGTTQIDHVVVSPFGVFVIETKNYKGWIYGKEDDVYWTQKNYRRTDKFYNPVRQNKGHAAALRELLKSVGDVPIYPIVVFTTKATFKKLEVTSRVTYSIKLVSVIKEFKEEVLSKAQVNKICEVLEQNNSTGREARLEHAKRVRTLKTRKVSIAKRICPLCGGTLIKREGKYDRFWGCSNYPGCRYTRKLSNYRRAKP